MGGEQWDPPTPARCPHCSSSAPRWVPSLMQQQRNLSSLHLKNPAWLHTLPLRHPLIWGGRSLCERSLIQGLQVSQQKAKHSTQTALFVPTKPAHSAPLPVGEPQPPRTCHFSGKSPPKPGSSPKLGGHTAPCTAQPAPRGCGRSRASRGAGDTPLHPKPGPWGDQVALPLQKGTPRRTDASRRMDRRVQPAQSQWTLTGGKVQRSGCPICSRALHGDVLQRKGGTSSQAGPLAATNPKVGAMPQEVT